MKEESCVTWRRSCSKQNATGWRWGTMEEQGDKSTIETRLDSVRSQSCRNKLSFIRPAMAEIERRGADAENRVHTGETPSPLLPLFLVSCVCSSRISANDQRSSSFIVGPVSMLRNGWDGYAHEPDRSFWLPGASRTWRPQQFPFGPSWGMERFPVVRRAEGEWSV